MQCPVCHNDSKVLDTRWIEEENSHSPPAGMYCLQ